MIAHVARKEFLVNVMTFRFAAAVVVCVTLMVVSASILVADYDRRSEDYTEMAQRHREELGDIVVFSQVKGWAGHAPAPLSFLCLGKDRDTGTTVQVGHTDYPTQAGGSNRANPLLGIFVDVDPVQVVGVLVSLLVLLFAYDAISGERERGTLPLTFANAVKRPEFLLGKYLGGMATVAVPIALGFALSLLVASTSPWFQLTAEAALRIAALAAVSLVYASVFFLLGLVISSSVRRSSTALILLFFAWICIVIIIPDTSAYVAKQWRPVPAGQEVKAQQSALKGEYWGKMREYAKQNRRPAERWDWDMIIGRSVNSGDIPFAYTCMFAPREAMGWYEKGTAYGVGQAEIYADRERRVYQEYRQHQQQQASLARSIASVSPTWVYSRAAQIVAGTDSERGRRLVRQASAFRDELRSYIGQSDGFSSMAYFTRMTSGDLLSFDELKEIKESRGKEAIAELARPWTEDLAPLQGVPEFRYEPEALGESLVRMAGPATWLVLLNAVLFALAYGSFTRQDLRQEVA